jgi:endonuclease-3
MNEADAARILELLILEYGLPSSPRSFLQFENPFQILVLTILSAQTTDKQVNSIRDELFSRYPSPAELARADQSDLEEIIRSCGYFHAKARYLIESARALVERFEGRVPRDMDSLVSLPGVGRKTANIVLNHGFGIDEGIAVDTHVRRLARRLGLTDESDPDRIEQDLVRIFPRSDWGKINYLLIMHGRHTCTAKKPMCSSCPLTGLCRYYREEFEREKGEGKQD